MSREPLDTPTETIEAVLQLLQHRERQLEAIRRVSDALFTHPSTEALVKETLHIALEVLSAEAGTVYLHDPSDNTLVFCYVIGGSGEELIGTKIPVDKGIAGEVFLSGKSRLDVDVQTSTDYNADVESRFGYSVRDMVTVAIRRNNASPIGVMQVLNSKTPPFTNQDREVLEVLCAQAATGMEYFQLVETSRKAEVIHVIGDVSQDIENMLQPVTSGVQTLEPLLGRLFLNLESLRSQYGDTPDVQNIAAEISELAGHVRNDYGWILQNVTFAAEQVQTRTREIADAVKGEIATPSFESGNINNICKMVVDILQAVAQKQKISLTLEADETLPNIEFDRQQMYSALYNLVNNALPETPEGGTVTVRTYQPDSDNVAIAVADNGRGIPEHIKLRLFTTEAISTKPGGSGLGTRMVMSVVRRHNGTIVVETEVGEGSTFTITLPRYQS